MYGDLADKLVAEARRAENLPSLPLYNIDFVRTITRETRELAALEDNLIERNQEGSYIKTLTPGVLGLCQRRNKRCLLAYHYNRLKKLENWAWNEQEVPDAGNLSTNELVYLRQFNELLVQFKENWEDVDLTGSMLPPKDMYVEVRCLKDTGEIQTEYGVFDLTKNSQFYVRQSDVQRLVQQGLVELVE